MYYRHVVAKVIFARIDKAIFLSLRRWIKRRHLKKGSRWRQAKYYCRDGLRNWEFFANVRNRFGIVAQLRLLKMTDLPIKRHLKIRAEATPLRLKSAGITGRRHWARFGHPNADGGLSTALSAAYTLPFIAYGLLAGGLGVLQGVYAKYYGISLASLAAIFLFVRIFDAVTDPLAGYWSDHLYQRTGSRKPMVLVGGVLMVASGYLLFAPLQVSVWFITVALTLFYIGMTIFVVPHLAWASDLSPSSASKARIFAARGLASKLSWMIFYVIPLLPFFATREITPATLKVAAVVAGIWMLVSLTLCLRYVPNAPAGVRQRLPDQGVSWRAVTELLQSILQSAPLQLIYAMQFVFGLSLGMWSAMSFLYVDVYLGFGQVYAETYLAALVVAMVATLLWCGVAIRFGKKLGLLCSFALLIGSYVHAGLLTPETASYGHIVTMKVINSLGLAGMIVMLPALMSEVIDYTALRCRTENAGSYFAGFAFVEKLGVALGMSVALAMAGSIGFDATASEQTSSGILGIKLAMAGIPSVIALLAMGLVVMQPITERRHAVIRKRLDALASRRSATVLPQDSIVSLKADS
jgi:glycoside/pentoside/hexuronide:cation symporter, GPH family